MAFTRAAQFFSRNSYEFCHFGIVDGVPPINLKKFGCPPQLKHRKIYPLPHLNAATGGKGKPGQRTPPAPLNTKISKMNHNNLEWTYHSLTIETCKLLCYNTDTMLKVVMLLDFQT